MRAFFVNEALVSKPIQQRPELSPEQKFAVDYLKTLGLKLVSTSKQLLNGSLIFEDDNGQIYGIFQSGYTRIFKTYSYDPDGRWQVLDRFEPMDYDEGVRLLSQYIIKKRKGKELFIVGEYEGKKVRFEGQQLEDILNQAYSMSKNVDSFIHYVMYAITDETHEMSTADMKKLYRWYTNRMIGQNDMPK